MNEREMLENAARACSEKGTIVERYYGGRLIYVLERANDTFWNPLHNSGDCGDMEAELGIYASWHNDYVKCYDNDCGALHREYFKDHASKQAARRYASTMVAALVGAKL